MSHCCQEAGLSVRAQALCAQQSGYPCYDHGHLSFSFWLEISVGDDEEAGVEWMERRKQQERAHAWDVVVHS